MVRLALSSSRTAHLLVGGLLMLPLLAGCSKEKKAHVEEVRPVRVQAVTFETGRETLKLAGTLAPRLEAPLAFQVTGKLSARPVDVGSRVTPGLVIGRLESEDFALQLRRSQALVISAEADLKRLQADLKRYEALKTSMVFTQATYDQRAAAASMAQQTLIGARSQVAIAERQMNYTTLTADTGGIVTAVLAELGQVIAAGQAIVRVARDEELEVSVPVPENRLAEARDATEARVTLWSEPDKTYRVRLRELAASADPQSRTYLAKYALLDQPQTAKMGMTATLMLTKSDTNPVASLPLSSVFQQGDKPAVWVVDAAKGSVSLKPVTVAAYHQDAVLLSGGVQPGDLVVTAGVHRIDPGIRVRILGAAPVKGQ
jgi:membrane fusion protein, multidrug efflux system